MFHVANKIVWETFGSENQSSTWQEARTMFPVATLIVSGNTGIRKPIYSLQETSKMFPVANSIDWGTFGSENQLNNSETVGSENRYTTPRQRPQYSPDLFKTTLVVPDEPLFRPGGVRRAIE